MKKKYTREEIADLADDRRYQAFVTRLLAERLIKASEHLIGDAERFHAGEIQQELWDLETALDQALYDLNNARWRIHGQPSRGDYRVSRRAVSLLS